MKTITKIAVSLLALHTSLFANSLTVDQVEKNFELCADFSQFNPANPQITLESCSDDWMPAYYFFMENDTLEGFLTVAEKKEKEAEVKRQEAEIERKKQEASPEGIVLSCNESGIQAGTDVIDILLEDGREINSIAYSVASCSDSFASKYVKNAVNIPRDNGYALFLAYETDKHQTIKELLKVDMGTGYVFGVSEQSILDVAIMKDHDIKDLVKIGVKSNYGRLIKNGEQYYERANENFLQGGFDLGLKHMSRAHAEIIVEPRLGGFNSVVSNVASRTGHTMSQNKSWAALVYSYHQQMIKIYKQKGFIEVYKEHAALLIMHGLLLKKNFGTATAFRSLTQQLDLYDNVDYNLKKRNSYYSRDLLQRGFSLAFQVKDLSIDSSALTGSLVMMDLFCAGKSAQALAKEDFAPGSKKLFEDFERQLELILKYSKKGI